MSKTFPLATALAIALGCLSAACGAHGPAQKTAAPPQVNQQRLAELDRVIAEVRTNLEATRTSAQQAESFEAATASQLAEFRTKVEAAAPPDGKARDQLAKTAADPAPQTAVQAALAAFEARAQHATAVAELRKAQVAAREARLARLEMERHRTAHPEAASGPTANDALRAAKDNEAAAKADVERRQLSEQQAELHSAQARDQYQRMREGEPAGTRAAGEADAPQLDGSTRKSP